MTPTEVTQEATRWMGTPWKHQGRTEYGCDCIGLVIGVAQHFGVAVDDRADYARQPNDFTLQEALLAHPLHRISDPMAGSIVLFNLLRFPQHVAIDCGDTFIHAYEPVKVVCRYPWAAKWRSRVVARYCFDGMEV